MTELLLVMIMIAIFHEKSQFLVFACEKEHLCSDFFPLYFIIFMHFLNTLFEKSRVGSNFRVGWVAPIQFLRVPFYKSNMSKSSWATLHLPVSSSLWESCPTESCSTDVVRLSTATMGGVCCVGGVCWMGRACGVGGVCWVGWTAWMGVAVAMGATGVSCWNGWSLESRSENDEQGKK